MNTQSLEKIKSLTQDAATVGGFHEWFGKAFADKAHHDKQNYGFNNGTGEYHGFKLAVWFYAYAGQYGSSSVYSQFDVKDRKAVEGAFIKALNHHQKLIFATMAEIMRKEAAALTEKAKAEIATLQQMLDSVNDLSQAAE